MQPGNVYFSFYTPGDVQFSFYTPTPFHDFCKVYEGNHMHDGRGQNDQISQIFMFRRMFDMINLAYSIVRNI